MVSLFLFLHVVWREYRAAVTKVSWFSCRSALSGEIREETLSVT
jgi:hypothetical protein